MTDTADRSQMRITTREISLAAVSGASLGIAWPGSSAPGLAFLFLVPYFAAVRGARRRRRLGLGWLAGTLAVGLATGETTAATLSSYFGLDGIRLVVAWIAAQQVLGVLPFAVSGLLAGDVDRKSPIRTFVDVGAAWVVGEALRSMLFPGAWLSLASALSTTPGLLGSASWFGEWGVSFWIAGLGALAYRGVVGPDRRRAWMTASCVVALLCAQGAWTRILVGESDGAVRRGPHPSDAVGLDVALVQSGVDSRDRSVIPTDAADLDRLIALSVDRGRAAELVVWPEGALRGIWPANSGLLDRQRLHPLGAGHLLLGAPWMDDPMTGDGLVVAAILVDGEGRIAGRHLKTRLVPMAENRSALAWLGLDRSDSSYAAAPAAAPLEMGRIRLGVSICYEGLFQSIARRQASNGAGILVDLSNESWLGTTPQGRAHMLAAAVLRSIEVQRPTLRATATGITAAIDATGRIVGRLPEGSPGVLRVRVDAMTGTTPFTELGPSPILLGCIGWTAIRIGRDRGRPRTSPAVSPGRSSIRSPR